MSFWQGFAQAFKDADDKKTQDRRITEERAYDAQVREDARKFERSMFWTRLGEERRTALMQAVASQRANSPKVDPKDRANLARLSARLGGVEGSEELMASAIQDPTVATSILSTIEEAERKAAENGMKGYRISGESLVENFNIYGFEGMVENMPTIDDILGADLTDPAVFTDMQTRVTQGQAQQPAFVADVNSDIFYQPDREGEKYTAEVFDTNVVDAARQEVVRLAESDPEGAAVLQRQIDLFGKPEGAAETAALREQFGPAAAERLRGFESTRSVDSNPGIILPEQQQEPTAAESLIQQYNQGIPIVVTQELADQYPQLSDYIGKSIQKNQ